MQYKIKELRLKKGMTQQELSNKSGVSRVTIVSLESGDSVNISVKILKKIANCLDVDVKDVFC